MNLPGAEQPETGASSGGASVHALGMVRRFGALTAVDRLDLTVRPGEIYGLLGPDGAGKTTTIRMLAGLIDPHEGDISILGQRPDSAAVREQVGLMPQRYSLYADLSVGENLDFFRELFCLSKHEAKQRIERLLAITRLGPFIDRPAGALSGGMYKKLALACALLHEPRVLLLDEPTNGVDPVSRRELWALLGEFVGQGMAVLVSTPYMDEAERCHRVGVLHRGRLLAEGAPDTLVRELPYPVVLVQGGERGAVMRALEGLDEIKASSPAGARVRLVLAPGSEAKVNARLAPLGASTRRVRADFEDLFLARLSEVEAA